MEKLADIVTRHNLFVLVDEAYFDIGYEAGKKAVMILKDGKKAGEIPSGFGKNLSLVINLKAAKAQGYDVPEKYLKMADQVFE